MCSFFTGCPHFAELLLTGFTVLCCKHYVTFAGGLLYAVNGPEMQSPGVKVAGFTMRVSKEGANLQEVWNIPSEVTVLLRIEILWAFIFFVGGSGGMGGQQDKVL
jgi:hypothetical protein